MVKSLLEAAVTMHARRRCRSGSVQQMRRAKNEALREQQRTSVSQENRRNSSA